MNESKQTDDSILGTVPLAHTKDTHSLVDSLLSNIHLPAHYLYNIHAQSFGDWIKLTPYKRHQITSDQRADIDLVIDYLVNIRCKLGQSGFDEFLLGLCDFANGVNLDNTLRL